MLFDPLDVRYATTAGPFPVFNMHSPGNCKMAVSVGKYAHSMGLIKDTKVGIVVDDAKKARANGQTVFVCLFKSGGLSGGGVSGELAHISAMVQAVEKEGWRLEQASYSDAGGKVDRMMGVFRPV